MARPRKRKPRPPRRRRPRFHASSRTLWFGDVIVKQYKVPAESQVLILEAFQELGWPAWIDDPLPPRDGLDSHQRLHDAIKRLNGRQHAALLRFHGDGTGTRVGWSARES